MSLERDLALATADAIRTALVPLVADLKTAQAAISALELRWNDVGAMRERLAVLEVMAPVPGPPGPAGPQGEKGDPGLSVKGDPGERGERGEPGEPGLSVKGERGDQGEPGVGIKGDPGTPGKDGLSIKGDPGECGPTGAPGMAGGHGKDGAGIADAMIDRDGCLILTFTDGRTKSVGVILGKDGASGLRGADGSAGRDGKDGADGLSPEDFDWDFDPDTRAFTIKFLRGGIVITERTKTLTGMRIYRGIWEQGKSYESGDVTTWGGSEWTAMAATKEKPGDGKTAWKLTVKHGEQGKIGAKGDPGRDGRDLTNLGPDGSKWGR